MSNQIEIVSEMGSAVHADGAELGFERPDDVYFSKSANKTGSV